MSTTYMVFTMRYVDKVREYFCRWRFSDQIIVGGAFWLLLNRANRRLDWQQHCARIALRTVFVPSKAIKRAQSVKVLLFLLLWKLRKKIDDALVGRVAGCGHALAPSACARDCLRFSLGY